MGKLSFTCIRCSSRYDARQPIDSRGCPACYEIAPSNLIPLASDAAVDSLFEKGHARAAQHSLWRYADALPVENNAIVSLGEGQTPLLHACKLGNDLGLSSLFIKDEGRNPTWSHKDRFSTVFVSHAKSVGAEVVATASSGNAGASLAAYAAAAGLGCIVSTFATTAGAMVEQSQRYGATVVPFTDKRDRWSFLSEGSKRHGWLVASPYTAPVVGSHPVGLTGYKTLAYEIADQSGPQQPDWCILPVCYGDALIGLWQGFSELLVRGKIGKMPRLVAAEIYGSLQSALAKGADCLVDQTMGFETLAVSIGTARSSYQALHALRGSEGLARSVGNDDLLLMQNRLARCEGLLCELASVAPLVVARDLTRDGVIKSTDKVVAIATASGLKDLDQSKGARMPVHPFLSVADALMHVEG